MRTGCGYQRVQTRRVVHDRELLCSAHAGISVSGATSALATLAATAAAASGCHDDGSRVDKLFTADGDHRAAVATRRSYAIRLLCGT